MTSYLKDFIIYHCFILNLIFQPTLAFIPLVCRTNSMNTSVNSLDDYSPIVCNAQYGKLYTKDINSDIEYIFVYSNKNVSYHHIYNIDPNSVSKLSQTVA